VERLYLDKTGAGVGFNDHCAMTYLGAYFSTYIFGHGMEAVSTTIRDNEVLSNYHNIFIPKAVKYSAGLIDYYFRGTISSGIIDADTNVPQFTAFFSNTSSQDFSNGTFYIFQDDSNSVRTLVAQTNLVGILPSGGSMTAIFSGLAPTNRLTIFYQGTIGVSNGVPLDPVDAGIAIAANGPVTQTQTYTYDPSLDSIGLSSGATISSNLCSADFPFTPTSGNYQVTINNAYMDDNGSIGTVAAPIAPSCAWPHPPITNSIVPAGAVSINGNRLSVNVTATDSGCGINVGWVDVSITWKAWPGLPQ
jgi:hypothetical protein